MPVYIFIATMGMGGSQRVCINLANEFARQGREVHIIVLHLKKDVNSNRLDERCKLHV